MIKGSDFQKQLFGPTRVTTDQPYLQQSLDNEDEQHVLNVCDHVLRLDGKGAFFHDAATWSDTRESENGMDPQMLGFQINLLLADTPSEGSCRPIADSKDQPDLYVNTCRLVALDKMNMAKHYQKELLERLVTRDRYFDKTFNDHVLVAKQEVLKEMEAKKKKGPKSKEPEDSIPTAPAAPKRTRAIPPMPNVETELVARHSPTIHDGIGQTTMSEDIDMEEHLEQVFVKLKAIHDAQSQQQEEVMEDLPPVAESKIDLSQPPQIMPKIQFTITPIKDELEESMVALYCRFLFRDPEVDPGKFINVILNNKKARAANAKKKIQRDFPDKFGNYTPYFGVSHHPAGNKFSEQAYFEMACAVNPSLKPAPGKRMVLGNMRYGSHDSEFHPFRLFSTDKAFALLHELKATAQVHTYREWWDPYNKVAKFPSGCPTIKMVPDAVFWYHPEYLHLSSMRLPHLSGHEDLINVLLMGGNVDALLDNRRPGASSRLGIVKQSKVEQLVASRPLVLIADVKNARGLGYETFNEFMHLGAESKAVWNKVMQERPGEMGAIFEKVQRGDELTNEERNAVAEYDRFGEIGSKVRDAFLKRFSALWRLEGPTEDLPIPDTIKCIINWYQEKRFPHMSRDFIKWDDKMGIFGNAMLRSLVFFSRIAKLLQPRLSILMEILLTTYCHHRKIQGNVCAHGEREGGKSTHFINATEMMCIKGTTIKYSSATPAANNTEKHEYDLIVLSDEMPRWKVNPREAEKVPQLVEAEKCKMTERYLSKKIFKTETGPRGESIRWNYTLHTDLFETRVECTNEEVQAKDALASRMHKETVMPPRIPPGELASEYLAEGFQSDMQDFLHINQYWSALINKAIQCGVIMEPDMQSFHDYCNKVRLYLQRDGVLHENAQRTFDIMAAMARQMTIRRAVTCAVDMPGGPLYQVPHQVEHVKQVEPYLVCEMEVTWFVITAMGNGLIEDLNEVVLRAIPKAFNFQYNFEVDAYRNYEDDINNTIPWRLRENPDQTDRKKNDFYLVDLQYITLSGTLESVCSIIANHCRPQESVVKGVFNILKKHPHEVSRAYMPQPRDLFRQWHKYRLDSNGQKVKEVDMQNNCPPQYVNGNRNRARRAQDVPVYPDAMKLQVVDLSDWGDRKIHIHLPAALAFSRKKLIDALVHATLHMKFPRIKMLLGQTDPNAEDKLQVRNFTETFITQACIALDAEEGYNAQGEWVGGGDTPEAERPVSRQKGIAFNRRANINTCDQTILTTIPSTPMTKEQERLWKEKREREARLMQNKRDIFEDVDRESFKRHALKCGYPLDEPLRTPEYCMEQYYEWCRENERSADMGLVYPQQWNTIIAQDQAVYQSSNNAKSMSRARLVSSMLEIHTENPYAVISFDDPSAIQQEPQELQSFFADEAPREAHATQKKKKRQRQNNSQNEN